MKLPFVDRIRSQNNIFAMGGENKATGDSKLNDSPDWPLSLLNIAFNAFVCKLLSQ